MADAVAFFECSSARGWEVLGRFKTSAPPGGGPVGQAFWLAFAEGERGTVLRCATARRRQASGKLRMKR